MAFEQKDNPLNGIEVVQIERCTDRNHFGNLIIWGACMTCNRTFGLATEDEPVFARTEKLKNSLI